MSAPKRDSNHFHLSVTTCLIYVYVCMLIVCVVTVIASSVIRISIVQDKDIKNKEGRVNIY